ncbi:ATP-dependent RecD-like DNA helicase [Leucobacter sp. PH1c]|uniref:ATP-dependent DNA helicase n=1 Tax=Leucobacter sp. PH1c TaxID=1397278 RepID=UPI0004685225|nr:ATP-dependent RecD-like DNA helicase [Leucobacter sp. PH1c]
MASIDEQIRSASDAICRNIEQLGEERDLLSMNVLQQLRNLVEALMVRAHRQDGTAPFHYAEVGPARDAISGKARLCALIRFHKLLQVSVSHYTLDGDPSERLMMKYYEYLIRVREIAQNEMGLSVLHNLSDFPTDQDPALREYHEKIAARIDALRQGGQDLPEENDRFYIHSSRPFVVHGRILYEVSYSTAKNSGSKADRSIAFTDIDMTDKYAASLILDSDHIEVFGKAMPITLIRSWKVSIRPCEIEHFAHLFGVQLGQVSKRSRVYQALMRHLTLTRSNLLDIMDLEDAAYLQLRSKLAEGAGQTKFLDVLDQARALIRSKRAGYLLIRYLMLRMRNVVLKEQWQGEPLDPLSGLHVSSSCRPFEGMPFCTSPKRHNPSYGDLLASIDTAGREHELLARRLRNNVETEGRIYTPAKDLAEHFGDDLDGLIKQHNDALPPTAAHTKRALKHDNRHLYIKGYEDDVVDIIKKLQIDAKHGIATHATEVEAWLTAHPEVVDDEAKKDALRALFADSKVAAIYGAAGTGKSTMVGHISELFRSEKKLFLAHTNPAIENLRRRTTNHNSEYRTLARHKYLANSQIVYDLVVIDESSTVGNADLLEVLNRTAFKRLVLVGDKYQIESIAFGNWFSLLGSYLPSSAVFELTTPYRTDDPGLLNLWTRVRTLDDRIEETLTSNGYSVPLDHRLFNSSHQDEIVLCLNYDGLYGINNINRFFQAINPNPAFRWNGSLYKVGDPVLFNELDLFRPLIFNNLKGTITRIQQDRPGRITFDVELDKNFTAVEAQAAGLRYVSERTVQFDVEKRGSSDQDDESTQGLTPFQVAYAVSIHKAQGLEYESVKIVITNANEGNITHPIFYTAITRARKHLSIYWSPEVEHQVLSSLTLRETGKDEALLKTRRGLNPTTRQPRPTLKRAAP